MNLVFEPIRIDRQADYRIFLAQSKTRASDYSFINLFGWAEEYGLTWAWETDLVWIRQARPLPRLWAPVGDWTAIDWEKRLSAMKPAMGQPIRIPEALIFLWQKALGARMVLSEARGDWDYLYRTLNLVELRGKQLHKKKNLLNQFQKQYDYRYQAFAPELIDQARAMQADWCTWRDCESSQNLAAENRAIGRVFAHWSEFTGITGGALMVADRLVAYTVAEALSPETMIIHFEKGDNQYKGVYQAINYMFLANQKSSCEWVNREQDLDDPGLRKAKLSYQPVAFEKKYAVFLHNE